MWKKYLITYENYLKSKNYFLQVLHPDSHNKIDGYTIRSLYFDTVNDDDFYNKIDGLETRRKIRIRIYDPDDEKITMSFGIAFNKDSKNLAELINKADMALYQSKENGKNKITDFAGNVDKIKKYKFTFSKLFLFKNIDRLLNKW